MEKIKLTIAIVTLLALLCSCGKSSTDTNNASDSNSDTLDVVTENESMITEKFETAADEDEFDSGIRIPQAFEIIDGSSVKTILGVIESGRKSSEKRHTIDRVEELREFYSLDSFKISGHELRSIIISDTSINYYFFPELSGKNADWSSPRNIRIWIGRSDGENAMTFEVAIDAVKNEIKVSEEAIQTIDFGEYRDSAVEMFESYIKENEEILNSKALLEDNLLYFKNSRRVTAPLGNTSFSITAPETLGLDEDEMYEFLRDLAFRVIESAELVMVE